MRENRATPLAVEIQNKLDNQGFLSAETLNPFLYQEIINALTRGGAEAGGIIFDGFPRCTEQLESFGAWPFQNEFPLASGSNGNTRPTMSPDIVLSFEVTKQNAKSRYLSRARDSNDSSDKFEKRFREFELETKAVEDVYRQRGILIDVRNKMFHLQMMTH